MVLLEYHGLWRSWVLVYTHLAVIGEQNVGLRAPGSADAKGRTLCGCHHCNRQLEHYRTVVEPIDNPSRIEPATKPLRRDRKSGTQREFSKRRRSSGEKLSPQAKSWSTPPRIVQQPLSLWLRTMITMFVRYHCGFAQ